jgi:hypothetical protein
MIIEDGEKQTLHRCPNRKHLGVFRKPEDTIENNGKSITKYYSEQEAKKAGWMCTRNIMFCEPGKAFVWVCPDCAKKVKWGKEIK